MWSQQNSPRVKDGLQGFWPEQPLRLNCHHLRGERLYVAFGCEDRSSVWDLSLRCLFNIQNGDTEKLAYRR